jgi:PAS domain S-box-containing protein
LVECKAVTEGQSVLVCAPFGRDAESVAELLAKESYEVVVCADVVAIARALDERVGAILVTEESLAGELEPIRAALAAQPAWSDIPFVLLKAQRSTRTPSGAPIPSRLTEVVGNTVVLERPLGVASLISAVASAMRARQRQFEMRDRLSELDRARRGLAESEAQLRLATDAAEIGFWDLDPINDKLYWPSRVKAMFGIFSDVDISMADFYAGVHPDDIAATSSAFAAAADPERRALYDVEYRTIGKEDRAIRWVAAKGRGIFEEQGRCVRLIGTAIDISEKKASELVLRENEEQLRLAMEAGGQGAWKLDLTKLKLEASPQCRIVFGVGQNDAFDYLDLQRTIHPEDLPRMQAAVERAIATRSTYDIEYRVIRSDRSEGWVHIRGQPEYAIDGSPLRMFGVSADITSRKRNELELILLNETLEQRVSERTNKLMEAEAALRQSQKMEAVGQLTGGIAHDFNNMLTGVIGGLDILKRRIASGRLNDLDRFMDAASASAQRAAALTARLLAFSRRQSLDAHPLDINALAASMEDLLARTVNENIALKIVPGEGSPHAIADPNQLENALLNLAINARDAMPDGGQLTVEVSTVALDEAYAAAKPDLIPGSYVVIAVSDSGVGMPPDMIDKVFEPFFTTKPIGEGTGLGLSMVYGFARQSGGQVRIHSRPGEGTSVKLYLPASDRASETDDQAKAAVVEGKGQTVLVVEDDPSVRLLVCDVLAELRYTTIEAGDAAQAIPILKSARSIDLLVSDVGLPGMNGRQLAELAREHRPNLPILFVTGYAENAAIRAGFLGTNMAMITKPFAIDSLAAKIDEMMA